MLLLSMIDACFYIDCALKTTADIFLEFKGTSINCCTVNLQDLGRKYKHFKETYSEVEREFFSKIRCPSTPDTLKTPAEIKYLLVCSNLVPMMCNFFLFSKQAVMANSWIGTIDVHLLPIQEQITCLIMSIFLFPI